MKLSTHIVLILAVVLILTDNSFSASTIKKDGRLFIKDRTGELWEITQAVKIGFKPEYFQYGIGKHAFTPLSNDNFSNTRLPTTSRQRVIGIADNNTSHAYSIYRLRYHEIANTTIAGKPITVGY